MTRRERLAAKMAKRREWAGKARRKSDARFSSVHNLADSIPLGQPILVGHHSERRARRDVERIHTGMDKACELANLANHHASKADGLANQIERSIFSDDSDAVQRLEEKIADLDAQRKRNTAINKAWKKAGSPASNNDAGWDRVASILGDPIESLAHIRGDFVRFPWFDQPIPAYANKNLGGNIAQAKKRIEEIRFRAKRAQEAETVGGIKIARTDSGYCNVTFAEKPDRAILNDLRAAGFHWSGGTWGGYTTQIPASVLSLEGGSR